MNKNERLTEDAGKALQELPAEQTVKEKRYEIG